MSVEVPYGTIELSTDRRLSESARSVLNSRRSALTTTLCELANQAVALSSLYNHTMHHFIYCAPISMHCRTVHKVRELLADSGRRGGLAVCAAQHRCLCMLYSPMSPLHCDRQCLTVCAITRIASKCRSIKGSITSSRADASMRP